MKQSFENLEVRKQAFELAKELGIIFYHTDFKNLSFQDQMMRSTLAISNNIAKGHDRGANNDYDNFLYMAHGSAAETKSMIYMAYELWYLSEEQKNIFWEKASLLMIRLSKLVQR